MNELNQRPTISTTRLLLRPFHLSDAKRVQELAGDPEIAATTGTIPHPYPDGAAEEWIGKHEEWFRKGSGVQFAIVLKETNELIGCIDLFGISKVHEKGEIGYWIGKSYWNRGYCSEAAIALVKFGFEKMNLNKITSRHITTNSASGKVMLKAGMKKEGLLRQEYKKNGHFVDFEVYGILRSEY